MHETDWAAPGIPEYEPRPPLEAAWYLTTSRIWPLVRHPVRGPIALGAVLAIVIIATVLLSPSTESRFIYTDF